MSQEITGPVNVDIVVVGAGLSGLSAAYNIMKHDSALKVAILEAKDRIGGRIHSVHLNVSDDKVCSVDLGGHWVSREQTLIMDLIKEFRLTIIPQCKAAYGTVQIDEDTKFSYTEHPVVGGFFTRIELNHFFTKLDHISVDYSFRDICKSKVKDFTYDSITMAAYIEKQLYTQMARRIANTIVKTSFGIEPTKFSLLSYLVFCNGTQGFTNQYMMKDGGSREFWLEDGTQKLCSRIVENLDENAVHYKTAVTGILRTNNYVIVETTGLLYKCLFMIMAIPPSEVLKINFIPKLGTEKCKILIQHKSKHLKKFAISYEQKFWESEGLSGQLFNCGDGPMLICYDASIRNHPILMGVVDMRKCSCKDCKCCKDMVTNWLVKHWGDVAKDPIDYVEKVWSDEIYNGSCPTYRPYLNNMHYCNKLIEPCGRIYWAGTETAERWNGFMEGAVQAGYRASLDVLYHLRPQSITLKDVILNEYVPVHKNRIVGNWYLSWYNPYYPTIFWCTVLIGAYYVYQKYIKKS